MSPAPPPTDAAVVLLLPFAGRWLVENSPARRVPSHGTDLMGTRWAIDFVGVDERHRTAPAGGWRAALATEPPERFVGWGRPVLAPADGVVVRTHDGEPDHEARRSALTLVPYALGQGARLRRGPAALAGNYVTLAAAGAYVTLVHLQRGSLQVRPGEAVVAGQPLGRCGNSGSSTQPHVHVQVNDGPDASVARALPLAFRGYAEWLRGHPEPHERAVGVPAEGAVVAPLPQRR
ncbi:M23 family metallopeptidase [Puerhibacterium sp. TATVAM-FAB25]|uniref:M23 family metallopeptidase n=1 Tax=Puerhibacterium sp. TATVAM-FAB25 TaxID=3093699 RepID=UPI00397D5C18